MNNYMTIKYKKITAVTEATFAVAKRESEKSWGFYRIRTIDIFDTDFFVINPWKDEDETMNIRKTY